jgi:hypothetical protein
MRLQPVALLLVVAACAHGPRGGAEVYSAYYRDDEGLEVITLAAAADVRVRGDDRAGVEVLVDRVAFAPVDAVTSASARTSDGGGLDKQRVEAIAGYSAALGGGEVPWRLGGQARASVEPEYLSLAGAVAGTVELHERNTRVAAALGFGRDHISPEEVAEGDEGSWPASHRRLTFSAQVTRLLGPRVDVSAGVGVAWQSGALASPYRRALVRDGGGLLGTYDPEPERHPGERTRVTGFAGGGWYLGRGVGLHARLGWYGDSWSVVALAPEVEAALELGSRAVATVGYRFYTQGRASFYEERYQDSMPAQSGDRRLGAVEEHLGSLEVAVWLTRSRSVELSGWYGLSRLAYVDLARNVTAHMMSLALSVAY